MPLTVVILHVVMLYVLARLWMTRPFGRMTVVLMTFILIVLFQTILFVLVSVFRMTFVPI